jgi:hypothetical protein
MPTSRLLDPARRALGPALFAAALTFIALVGAVAVSDAPHVPPAHAPAAAITAPRSQLDTARHLDFAAAETATDLIAA